MIIQVEQADKYGNKTTRNEMMSFQAFIKHFAISGQGFVPSIKKTLRIIGAFLFYRDYLNFSRFNIKNAFGNSNSMPYDPTSKNHFSNLTGLAIADFLSRKIFGITASYSYESACFTKGIKINGKRPDLLCVNKQKKEILAIEAKGFSDKSISDNVMQVFKAQANSGPLPVAFSVASVAYNLYNSVKVKYYDPSDDAFVYDEELINKLEEQFYRRIQRMLRHRFIKYYGVEKTINTQKYLLISIPWRPYFEFKEPFFPQSDCGLKISFLIDKRIVENNVKGLRNIEFKGYEDDRIYIDSDGIGILYNNFERERY